MYKRQVKDLDLAVQTLKRKYIGEDIYVPTSGKYAFLDLPPEQIMPHSKGKFKVRVEIPKKSDYTETAMKKGGKEKELVAFKLNVIVKASEYVPA